METGAVTAAPHSPGAAAGGATSFVLSDAILAEAGDLTVEAWLKGHMERLVNSAEETVDEAIDTLLLTHKAAREEIRNAQHIRRAEQGLKNKAAKRVNWDVQLTIESAGAEEQVGLTFTIQPRQRSGGMCRIGRSTGAEFVEPGGVSLAFDSSVSVWHGKFTAVYGQIYYSDLNTRNGSTHNGVAAPKDQPILLADGDELGLGEVRLRVKLVPAAVDAENAGPAGDDDL